MIKFRINNPAVAFVFTMAVAFRNPHWTSYHKVRPEDCRTEVRSRPDAEYDLCGLHGDKTVIMSQRDVFKVTLQTGRRESGGRIRFNMFDTIQHHQSAATETDCGKNSTVCYVPDPSHSASCFHLFDFNMSCHGDKGYSFGMDRWNVKVRSNAKFIVNVPEVIFNTTGQICNFCFNSSRSPSLNNHHIHLKTVVKLYCDERYNKDKILQRVELPVKSSDALIVKMYTKQSCLAYKSPKPTCLRGNHVVCPFRCTSNRGNIYSIAKIKPKKFTLPGTKRTFFFGLCHGMNNINSPVSRCRSNNTIVCERTCDYDPRICDRPVVSMDDDIEIELIPDGFVWNIYPNKSIPGEERVKKAVISFYCDELIKVHVFRLTHAPSQTLWFSLVGPCVCKNSNDKCVDFVPPEQSSNPFNLKIIIIVVGTCVVLLIVVALVFWRKQKDPACPERKPLLSHETGQPASGLNVNKSEATVNSATGQQERAIQSREEIQVHGPQEQSDDGHGKTNNESPTTPEQSSAKVDVHAGVEKLPKNTNHSRETLGQTDDAIPEAATCYTGQIENPHYQTNIAGPEEKSEKKQEVNAPGQSTNTISKEEEVDCKRGVPDTSAQAHDLVPDVTTWTTDNCTVS